MIVSRWCRLRTLTAALLLAAAVTSPLAAASLPEGPPQTTGGFHSAAYGPLPAETRVDVRLMDDSPENLELGWRVQEELRRKGLAGEGGRRLVLTIETDVSIIAPSGGQGDAEAKEGDLDVVGFLRATLEDPETWERLWTAEAAYRRSDGDLVAGARALVPLLVEQLGRSAELDSVTIR